jgi:hypothetical protein
LALYACRTATLQGALSPSALQKIAGDVLVAMKYHQAEVLFVFARVRTATALG